MVVVAVMGELHLLLFITRKILSLRFILTFRCLHCNIFRDTISEDVVMSTRKRQNKSYHAFTWHFMLGFNISYKTTLPAWPISGLGICSYFSLLFGELHRQMLLNDNT